MMHVTEIGSWNERWRMSPEQLAQIREKILCGEIAIGSAPKGMLDWPRYRDDLSDALAFAWEVWRK